MKKRIELMRISDYDMYTQNEVSYHGMRVELNKRMRSVGGVVMHQQRYLNTRDVVFYTEIDANDEPVKNGILRSGGMNSEGVSLISSKVTRVSSTRRESLLLLGEAK